MFTFTIVGTGVCQDSLRDTIEVNPGDGTISGKRFMNYENVWRVTDIDPMGKETVLGTWYDTVRLETLNNNNEKVLVRRQHVEYSSGHIRKHFDIAHYETLLPIHVRVVAYEKKDSPEIVVTDIIYSENSFTGKRRYNIQGKGATEDMMATVDMRLAQPVYDWHMWGILISGFPLKQNYAARFLTHTSTNTTSSPFLWVTLSVTGSDFVVSKKWGKIDCWIVAVDAEVPWTFWIAKDEMVVPIQKIKIDQTPLGGTISWWKSIE